MNQRKAEHRKRKKGSGAIAAVMVIIIAAGIAGWFATEDMRNYNEGIKLLEDGDYLAASAIFGELEDYMDSPERLKAAEYGEAQRLLNKRKYLEAAESFAELDGYSDSYDKMCECYYKLAKKERGSENIDSAYEYFILADEYEDAAYQAEKTMYQKGHKAFIEGDYDAAFECFDILENGEEEYGKRHFITLADAEEYLDEQLDLLKEDIGFYVGEMPDSVDIDADDGENEIDIYNEMINYLPFYLGSSTYDEERKQVSVYVMNYCTGDVILDAWENGDTSGLTEDEKAVLELAEELLERAKAGTDSKLELEIWIHDWICENTSYENPDMDVEIDKFLELRQLSCIGAMLDGKANCQGYTDTFYLLGNMAGFEVERVTGDADGGHIWNTVLLDGQRYIVDTTFDDYDDEYGGWTYTYFNAPWDSELYLIYGGAETVPHIAVEFDSEKSYYALNENCFDNIEDAAEYIVNELENDRYSWAYAVVEGHEVSTEAFELAFDAARGSRFRGEWGIWYVEHYAGNTYISMRFD